MTKKFTVRVKNNAADKNAIVLFLEKECRGHIPTEFGKEIVLLGAPRIYEEAKALWQKGAVITEAKVSSGEPGDEGVTLKTFDVNGNMASVPLDYFLTEGAKGRTDNFTCLYFDLPSRKHLSVSFKLTVE